MTRVLVLAGDGIGREVTPVALDLLNLAAEAEGLKITWIERACGAQIYLDEGVAIAPETKILAREVDAIFVGAVGLPAVRRPDGSEVADEVVLDLRSDLDLFANIRPVRSWPNLPGPLHRQNINYTIVRENTEGLYISRRGGIVLRGDIATDTMVITRFGTERVVRLAFELAARSSGRPCDGQRVVTCVDKANTLRSYILFRTVFTDVAATFPNIRAECEHADAVTARMVLRPETLNVVVCENMLGDILSDLAAATVGGLGLAPSANIGVNHGLFEPTHGSAPDIAGRGIANPLAAILSGAMMLEWLSSSTHDPAMRAAARIRDAVRRTFQERQMTRDLGGLASMADIANTIRTYLW